MRLYTLITALLMAGILVLPVFAQTQTPSEVVPSPTLKNATPTTALDEEVDKLKEKVAEKVTELKGKNEKATAGIVKTITEDSLVITQGNAERDISLDKTLSKYYEVAGVIIREIKRENIVKNDYVFILGPDINGEITANAIYRDQPYTVLSGKIIEVSSAEYTVKMISLDKTNYTLDIQTRTSQQLLNTKTLQAEKIGFSKLKEGDSIHVVVLRDLENPKSIRFDAERILIIPNEYFMQ